MSMTPEELAKRASRIRIPQKAIAATASLDVNTVSRTLAANSDPLNSTLEKISAAVIAEEIRLRDYLLTIHPLAEKQAAA